MSLREHIRAQREEREARYAGFRTLIEQATAAGRAAGEAIQPRPMNIVNPATGQRYHVAEGVCGFATVRVTPGTTSFARWLVKEGIGYAAYGGGVAIPIHAHEQSLERKQAHANAFAAVLREQGIKAYPESRLD